MGKLCWQLKPWCHQFNIWYLFSCHEIGFSRGCAWVHLWSECKEKQYLMWAFTFSYMYSFQHVGWLSGPLPDVRIRTSISCYFLLAKREWHVLKTVIHVDWWCCLFLGPTANSCPSADLVTDDPISMVSDNWRILTENLVPGLSLDSHASTARTVLPSLTATPQIHALAPLHTKCRTWTCRQQNISWRLSLELTCELTSGADKSLPIE